MICCLVWRGAASVVLGWNSWPWLSPVSGRGMRPFYRGRAPRSAGRVCAVQFRSGRGLSGRLPHRSADGRHLDGDRHAVGVGADINAAVVHQGAFDFVEDRGDAAAIELLRQLTNGDADCAGFHGCSTPRARLR